MSTEELHAETGT